MPSVLFQNTTDLPVMIDSWQHGDIVLNTIRIAAKEERLLESSTGEWYMHTMFVDQLDKFAWLSQGFTFNLLGKFRHIPCALGDYAWMDVNDFDCRYIQGNIIFYMNKKIPSFG